MFVSSVLIRSFYEGRPEKKRLFLFLAVPERQLPFQIPLLIAYTLVFFTGIIGNLLVCYVVVANNHMQNTTNFFILNLAVADILLCVLGVPFTALYSLVIDSWVFGSFLCYLVPFSQCASCYMASWTLLAIAIYRYTVICHPSIPKMRGKACFFCIVLIILVSSLAALPYAFYMELEPDEKNREFCGEDWPKGMQEMYGVVTLFLQFLVPFVIITICYVCISVQLRRRQETMAGTRSVTREEESKEKNRKVNRMLIAMVVIFAVSWLPMNMINMLTDLVEQVDTWRYIGVTFFWMHCLAMSSACYNPFLYAWLNENFRQEFLKVLPFCREDNTALLSVSLKRPSVKKKSTNFEMRSPTVGNDTTRGVTVAEQPASTNNGRLHASHNTRLSTSPITTTTFITNDVQNFSPKQDELDLDCEQNVCQKVVVHVTDTKSVLENSEQEAAMV